MFFIRAVAERAEQANMKKIVRGQVRQSLSPRYEMYYNVEYRLFSTCKFLKEKKLAKAHLLLEKQMINIQLLISVVHMVTMHFNFPRQGKKNIFFMIVTGRFWATA